MSESRESLEARLLFNSGGYSFGTGGSLAWSFSSGHAPDLPSVVAITGPAEKYTDTELQTLADVSDALTAAYDEQWTERRGANLWIVDKVDYDTPRPWMVKRLTWEYGYPHHETLSQMLDWWATKQ